jgi:serine/threonine protein phosphatase 1
MHHYVASHKRNFALTRFGLAQWLGKYDLMTKAASWLVAKDWQGYVAPQPSIMINALRKLFQPHAQRPQPAIPPGERVYAVGDVHGRLDLFNALIAAIEADDSCRWPAETTIVLLGDLVDRGEDSAGVLAAARALGKRRKVRIIGGNHEEMFLRCFDDLELIPHFMRYGGRETVLSYAVGPEQLAEATPEEIQLLIRTAVPPQDVHFMQGFEDHVLIGDYLFVHAGIKPGGALEEQSIQSLRWIREPFLSHSGDHGYVVVHGHTIAEAPVIKNNRIGIDTGAYLTGKLTALGLEGAQRWLVETDDDDGVVTTETRPA